MLWQVFELARQLESESVAVKHLFAISSNLLEQVRALTHKAVGCVHAMARSDPCVG